LTLAEGGISTHGRHLAIRNVRYVDADHSFEEESKLLAAAGWRMACAVSAGHFAGVGHD
jgi:hypothetical protein